MTPEEAQKRDDADLRVVMSTSNGRRFMWRLLVQAGLQTPSFVGGDALATAYNEGRRSVVLALRGELERVDVELYAGMLRESLDAAKEARDAAEKQAAKTP